MELVLIEYYKNKGMFKGGFFGKEDGIYCFSRRVSIGMFFSVDIQEIN